MRGDFIEKPLHLGEHRPVHHRDELALGENLDQLILRQMRHEIFPVHLLEALMFSEHELSVVKLDGVCVSGFGNGMHHGRFCKILKHWVHRRISQVTNIRDRRTVSAERIRHDGSVPAQFPHLDDHFHIRAVSGGFGDFFRELGHPLNPGVFFSRLAGFDHVKNRIHKAVKANEYLRLAEFGGGVFQGLNHLTWKRTGCVHPPRIATENPHVQPAQARPQAGV
jgi:hypothetical protein